MAPMNPNIPLDPPAEWFTPPSDMPKDAGCIVEPNGRIYGYLCHWGAVLMDGSKDRWTAPRTRCGYAYAHTGDTLCADGSTIKTANLGGDAGHAPRGDLDSLQEFYENTQTQLARVRYGEDANGVWFAGACWPTVTDLDIAKLRASARSGHWAAVGDWRDVSSGRPGYELVGACLVNVPGFKYARADKVASGVLMLNPITLDAAGGANHQGAMVALFLDAQTASALAVDGGEPADDLHITLAYFDDEAADRQDWDAIHALVANVGAKHLPLSGKVSGQGHFVSEDGVVHWAAPDVPGLAELRTELCASLDTAGFAVRCDHGFQPHITLLYGNGDDAAPDVPVVDIAFDRLTLAVGGNMTELATQTVEHRVAASGTIEFAPAETEAPSTEEVAVGGVLVVENQPTEDGRFIEAGAIEWRDLPLPLYAKLENTEGHSDAQLVGRIDEIHRDEAAPETVMWSGVVIPAKADGYGQKVLESIGDQSLKGVSIDGIGGPEDCYIDENEMLHFTRMVIGGATLTPMPAISNATVTIGGDTAAATEQETSSMNAETEFAPADQTEGTDGGDTTDAVDAAQDDTAGDTDAVTALGDKVDGVADRLEYLIGLFETAQTNAREASVQSRLAALEAKTQ